MSDAGKSSLAVHVDAARDQRARFERRAMAVIIACLAFVLIACFIALYPAPWAVQLGERINTMRDSILFFIGLISANLGISFTKGGHDQAISRKDDA